MRRSFLLVLCSVLAVLAPRAASAAQAPKQICLEWTSDGDPNGTVTMDVVLKAQGSMRTLDQGDGAVKLRFYSIHGISGLGLLPGAADRAERDDHGGQLRTDRLPDGHDRRLMLAPSPRPVPVLPVSRCACAAC